MAAVFFVSQFVLLDLWLRGVAYGARRELVVIANLSIVSGVVVWKACERRSVRFFVSILTAALIVSTFVLGRHYGASLDGQMVAAAIQSWGDVKRSLWPLGPRLLAGIVVIGAWEWGLLGIRRKQDERRGTWLGHPAVLGAIGLALFGLARVLHIELRDFTPEWRLLDALSGVGRHKTRESSVALSLGSLHSTRKLPNVLLVLTESVRADDYCKDPKAPCDVAPLTHGAAPHRVAFVRANSVSSYTAVAVQSLLSGRVPSLSRAEVLASPLVFDYLRALTGARGERVHVAYWASQSQTIFERTDIPRVVDSFVSLETMTGRQYDEDPEDTGFDRLLRQATGPRWQSLQMPAFVMFHAFGTHAPYFVEPKDTPFSPWGQTVSFAQMEPLHNAYRNAIHEQDKVVAEAIQAFVARSGPEPWIVLLTSDHGESFGEHRAIHHGQHLYAEQIHVPLWMAWGNGALSDEESRSLKQYVGRTVTHLDLLPTLLDVYGIFDAAKHRGLPLDGRSLLREAEPLSAVPATNCTELFRCPINSWGALGEDAMLHAQAWDADWHCSDLLDASELPVERCSPLRSAVRRFFRGQPNGLPHR